MSRRTPPRAVDPLAQYLDEIGQHPLLSKDDEIALAGQIDAGNQAAAELAAGAPPRKRAELRRLVAAGEAARQQFINSNLRLVVSIAKTYPHKNDMALLDLIQDGNLGLIHAVGKFDWRKGFKFSTYATWWIRQAITRGRATKERTIRFPDEIARLSNLVHSRLNPGLRTRPDDDDFAGIADELNLTVEQVAAVASLPATVDSLDAPVRDDWDLDVSDTIPADDEAPEDLCRVDTTVIEKRLWSLPPEEADALRRRMAGEQLPERVLRAALRAADRLAHPSANPLALYEAINGAET